MRRRVCPHCKISSFYILNEKGERRLVYVKINFEVVPAKEREKLGRI